MRLRRLDREEAQRLGSAGAVAAELRRLVAGGDSVAEQVSGILEAVRAEGDEAVARYTSAFDTSEEPAPPLVVQEAELDAALLTLAPELVAGLQVAISNVANVAEAGVGADVAVELPQGQRVTLREVPVESAAVYVPGGRAPYPSTVVMGVVTARAAGVLDVAVCSPPGAGGEIDPTILGVCRLCGVERVYRMGGAQAIAALAYGTATVTPVQVVVGPGNLYVQEAKRQLSGVVGIDGFAGPSDLMALVHAGAEEPELRVCALDLLAQGEHGAGSLVVAVSPSAQVCARLASLLEEMVRERPTVGEAAFAVLEAESAREALALANAFAPEHLQLLGPEMEALAPLVRAAGCVFVGSASGTAFGDYVAGSNHVLPTGGAAAFASALSVRHFRRLMYEVRVGAGANRLAVAGARVARAEGFEVHAESMEARIGENPAT